MPYFPSFYNPDEGFRRSVNETLGSALTQLAAMKPENVPGVFSRHR
jgi:hypothetical protein